MKVKDLLKLKPAPITISSGKAVEYAMRLMLENNISSLVIVDDNEQPVSIITERDIFHLAYRFRGDMMDMKVGESKKDKLFVGRPDDDIKRIAKMMTENNIRHVPIMGEDNHLTGVISIRDIVRTTTD
jgi:CBS domain-containing protein